MINTFIYMGIVASDDYCKLISDGWKISDYYQSRTREETELKYIYDTCVSHKS